MQKGEKRDMYEFLWFDKHIKEEEWLKIVASLAAYIGNFRCFEIILEFEDNTIHYYLKTNKEMPIRIKGNMPFLLRKTNYIKKNNCSPLPYFCTLEDDALSLYNKTAGKLKFIDFRFKKLCDTIKYTIDIDFGSFARRLYFVNYERLLSFDFKTNPIYFCKKVPSYFNLTKTLPLLKKDNYNSIFKIDTFPYSDDILYLSQDNYKYDGHSLILGSSGSGKSKFISLFVKNTLEHFDTRVVVIDPHGALKDDIGGLGKVIDFENESIDLFGYTDRFIASNQEKIVTSIKSILKNNFNSKVERLLKYSVYLLLLNGDFTLSNLKLLLTDTNYRNSLLNKVIDNSSIISFFTNDFNDLKSKSYSEAFLPIISLADELSFIPSFNHMDDHSIEKELEKTKLLLFSLSPSQLGLNNVELISALIMNKIMSIKESMSIKEDIIFIVDEVSLVENEVLARILSEGRKYGLSLMLAGQFLNQLSSELKSSIFANTLNYYLFRISKNDAIEVVDNIDIDLVSNQSKDERKTASQNVLTGLSNRELIIKFFKDGKSFPCLKAKTRDFQSVPWIKPEIKKETAVEDKKFVPKDFYLGGLSQKDILKTLSTKRKVIT